MAVGKLLNLNVICPDCNNEIIFDSSRAEPKVKRSPKNCISYKKTYGRDKLFIDDMHDNKEGALKAGHSHYYDGRSCKNGHFAPKTKRGECNECCRIQAKKSIDLKKRQKIRTKNFEESNQNNEPFSIKYLKKMNRSTMKKK